MAAQHRAGLVHNLARRHRVRPQLAHHIGIAAARHKTDILAVRLGRHRQAQPRRLRPHRVLVHHAADREHRALQLRPRRREQEPALVALRIHRTVQFRPLRPVDPPHIMPGGQPLGPKITRQPQQIAELHALVAAHAGHRRLARRVAVGKILHHRGPEPRLGVDHVMRDAQLVGHPPGVMDVLAGAARALAAHRGAMVVKLQRDPDHLVARLREQPGDHRAVDAA